MKIPAELIDHLNAIKTDPAMIQAFLAQNPGFNSLMGELMKVSDRKPIRPLPSTKELTAVEIAVMDNWPQGKAVKSKPIRYGFALNASADPAPKALNWPFHFSGSLLTREELAKKATDLASTKLVNPISADYREFIAAIVNIYPVAAGTPDGYWFGLLQAKPRGEGTIYPDQHVLVVERDTTKTKLTVTSADLWVGTDEGPLSLAAFVPWFAGKKPVSNKVILQSRTATVNVMRGWRT